MLYPSATGHGLEDRAGAALLSSVWFQKAECTAAAYLRSASFHIAESKEVTFPDKVAEEYENIFALPPKVIIDFDKPSLDLATA